MQIFYCYQDVPILQSSSQKNADVSNDVIIKWPNYFQSSLGKSAEHLGSFIEKFLTYQELQKSPHPSPLPFLNSQQQIL